MPDFVYLNDRVVPAHEAKVSVFDHGFLYGDGLFETMRACETKIFLLEEHLDRLYRSAEILDMKLPWSKQELIEALVSVLEANKLEDVTVRLTVSRGEGLPVPNPAVCEKPTLVITCRPAPELKSEIYENGVEVSILETRRNLNSALPVIVKSCNFLNNIIARQELKKTGAYEGLMLNSDGYITEATVNNVFFVKNGRLLTPDLDCGLLDGVMRAYVLKLAKEAGVETEVGKFTVDDITNADEVFLTNSVSFIVPVRKIGGQEMSETPGKVAAQLLQKAVDSFVR